MQRHRSVVIVSCAALLLVASSAVAQSTFVESELPGSFPLSGAIGIGDLDADGQRDMVSGNLFSLDACSGATGAGNPPFKQVPNPAGPFFLCLSLWHQMWFQDLAASAGVSATNGTREIFK